MVQAVGNILKIDASARYADSYSRQLTDYLVSKLVSAPGAGDAKIVERDVAKGLPFVDETWIGGNFTDPAERTPAQNEALALSEELIGELEAADVIVIGAPIYNFSVPASFKAYVDQVARARRTFAYSSDGPKGLLKDRPVYVVVTSGGTEAGSAIDFATGYLKHVLGFLGLFDVRFIHADRLMAGADEKVAAAKAQIDGATAG